MTTGNIMRGSINSQSYFRRSWTGTNDPAHVAWNNYSCFIDQKFSMPAYQPVASGAPLGPPLYGMEAPDFNVAHSNMMSFDGGTELKALAKAHEEVLSHSFHGGVFLKELGESVGTIVNTSKACFSLLRAIKHCDIPGVARAIARIPGQTKDLHYGPFGSRRGPKGKIKWGITPRARQALSSGDVSGAWLALQYGWLPLVKDLQEALKAFSAKGRLARSVDVVGRAKSPVRWIDATVSGGAPHYTSMKLEEEFVTYIITFTETVSTLRQLGLDDWGSVVWEAIPFSYVADWFIPIGTYLGEFAFWRGTNTKWKRTRFQRATFSYRPIHWTTTGQAQNWGGRHNGSVIHVIRDSGIGIIVPPPSFKTLGKACSNAHLENAAALIHQLVLTHRA